MPAAVLSLGGTRDSDTCRSDITAFLNMIAWPAAQLEVNLWTSSGPPLVTRRWEVQGNLEELIEEATRFIIGHPSKVGATLLVESAPPAVRRDRRPRFLRVRALRHKPQ
jgi:hypothetical protein